MANEKNILKILEITKTDQYSTVEELFEKSRPNSIYYTLLILSSFIVACGLLLDNSTIVIGGMLVAPLLTPILIMALGIVVGEFKALKAPTILILKSALTVVVVSFLLAILFGSPETISIFENSLRVAILYFIVAIASGMAATFAWARKDIMDILPGIAIAVSLVPPLSALGISLVSLNLEIIRTVFAIFVFNLIGIVLGSLVVFSLLRFQKAQKIVAKEADAQETKEKTS